MPPALPSPAPLSSHLISQRTKGCERHLILLVGELALRCSRFRTIAPHLSSDYFVQGFTPLLIPGLLIETLGHEITKTLDVGRSRGAANSLLANVDDGARAQPINIALAFRREIEQALADDVRLPAIMKRSHRSIEGPAKSLHCAFS